MKSQLSIAGHPIHPAVVALPIGLFVWSLVACIVYVASDSNQMWYDISYWSAIAGIIAAIVAAAAGAVDGLTIGQDSDARSTVMAHAGLNVVVLALFVVAVLMMRNDGAVDGSDLTLVVILQAVAVGLLALSGWLGGELVFRHHLGMIPEDADVAVAERRRHGAPAGRKGFFGR
jgi:uncharacterized membrane protein